MHWKDFILGTIFGAVITGLVNKFLDKGFAKFEKWNHDRKHPKLPAPLFISGIKKRKDN